MVAAAVVLPLWVKLCLVLIVLPICVVGIGVVLGCILLIFERDSD